MQEKYVNQNNKKALKIKASEQFTYIYYVNHFCVFLAVFHILYDVRSPLFSVTVKNHKKEPRYEVLRGIMIQIREHGLLIRISCILCKR